MRMPSFLDWMLDAGSWVVLFVSFVVRLFPAFWAL